jgi:hypothetical protein
MRGRSSQLVICACQLICCDRVCPDNKQSAPSSDVRVSTEGGESRFTHLQACQHDVVAKRDLLACYHSSPLIGVVPGLHDRIAVEGVLANRGGRLFVGDTPIEFANNDHACEGRVLVEGTVAYCRGICDSLADGPPRLVDAQLVIAEPSQADLEQCEPVPLVGDSEVQALPNPDECAGRGPAISWRVMLYFTPNGHVRFVDLLEPADPSTTADCVRRHFMSVSIEPFGGDPVGRSKIFTLAR